LFLGNNAALSDFVDGLQPAVYVLTPSQLLALSMRAWGDVLFPERCPGPAFAVCPLKIGTAGGNGSAKRIGERHRPGASVGTPGLATLILHP
jgi:hypothetical protein